MYVYLCVNSFFFITTEHNYNVFKYNKVIYFAKKNSYLVMVLCKLMVTQLLI